MEDFIFKMRNAAWGLLLLLAGCFTLTETPLPQAAMTAPPASGKTVSIRGFDATISECVSVTGVQTVYVDRYWDGWWGAGHYETVPVMATVMRPRETDFFRERARSRFEDSGWSVMAQVPDCLVEVKFSGPTLSANAGWWRAIRVVGTIFFSDRAVVTWHAKLRIYDNRTGKLLMTRDLDETDEESMFSLIPVFGIISYDKTDFECMRFRCLTALTDRATSEASAFLSGGKR